MSETLLKIVSEYQNLVHLQMDFDCEDIEADDRVKMAIFDHCERSLQLKLAFGPLFFQGFTPEEYFENPALSYSLINIWIHEGWLHHGSSYLLEQNVENAHERRLAADSGNILAFAMDEDYHDFNVWESLGRVSADGISTALILEPLANIKGLRAFVAFGHDGMRLDVYLKRELLPLIQDFVQ